ncbi:MAG: oligosaccharide flippase family protein [Acidobacteria bacterium]|nr:oligosaccharide flippase family protein [Acidobacteriota bacterium]
MRERNDVLGARRLLATEFHNLKRPLTQRLFKSEFARNIAALMTGTSVAQAVPLLLSPVTTRLFRPEDYGVLAIYMTVAGVLAVFATGQYAQAILLPKEESEAINLLALSVTIAGIVGILTFLIPLLFGGIIATWLANQEVKDWLYLIPISVFLNGIIQSLTVWASRQKLFTYVAKVQVAQVCLGLSVQLIFGLLKPGVSGLILGLLTGYMVNAGLLLHKFWQEKRGSLSSVTVRDMLGQASQHQRFFKYSLPIELLNTSTNQLPVMMLNTFFGSAAVGHYGLAQRILGLPISLISSSTADVFRQRASSDYAHFGSCQEIFVKTMKGLFAISIIPFLALVFLAPPLFTFAFGARWREAGVFTQVLGVLFFFRFTCSPLSILYTIAGRQKEDMWLHILMVAITTYAIYLGASLSTKPFVAILLFSLSYSMIYLTYLVRSYGFSKGNK